jgi:diguanylate cyclase (GGDEF)-like protein
LSHSQFGIDGANSRYLNCSSSFNEFREVYDWESGLAIAADFFISPLGSLLGGNFVNQSSLPSFTESDCQPTILIIDDNLTNLRVAVSHLQESGFTVLVAQDGKSGLERAEYAHPQLILLDILMPDLDGFETCRQLKLNDKTCHVPIIFMSALSDTEDKVKGFNAGAVDYVTKPIQREELLARITTHLRIQALTQQLQRQNQQLQQQAIALAQAKQATEDANQELQRVAYSDSVTAIANRRRFDQHLRQEWQRLARDREPLSLILCDIDYFKRYNDHYGHQAGDFCLKEIAQAMDRIMKRASDLVARYGGEEFAIILPNVRLKGAIHIARLIQMEIRHLEIPHAQSSVSPNVTLSLGISSQIPNLEYQPESLITAADRALYQAKAQGRNTYALAIAP